MRVARRSFVAAGVLALAAGSAQAASSSHAEAWPSRSVRLVLPFGPGSATDTSARLLQERLSARWGQPVVIENKPGGDGLIAITAFTSAADHHVLLLASSTSIMAHPYQHARLPYERERDLEPIARIANTVIGVAVPASLNIGSVRELVARARAQPNKLNFAAAAGLPTLMLDSFVRSEKLEVATVPYKDIVQASTDLGEDRLQLLITSFAILKPLVASGKVKVLAVTSRERSELIPSTPTVLEEGFDGLELSTPTGLFGPRGMPLATRERIARDVADALSDPAISSRIASTGQNVSPGGPAEFAQALEEQAARAAEIAEALGVGRGSAP